MSKYDEFFNVKDNVYTCPKADKDQKCKDFKLIRKPHDPTTQLNRHLQLPIHADDWKKLNEEDEKRAARKRKSITETPNKDPKQMKVACSSQQYSFVVIVCITFHHP
jgi:hypothetical protein